jgi:nondiscriminating aspartyl-tRNA synthetase
MQRTRVTDCNNKIDETVTIAGYVQTRRDHGKIVFLDVSDRTGTIQVVLMGDKAGDLHAQDVVLIEGKVSKRPEHLVNKNLETGGIELQGETVEVLSKSQELPFDMGDKTLDLQLPTLLDNRSLTLRHLSVSSIFKVQHDVLQGFKTACLQAECTEIVVPTVAASSTEGGAEVFKVDYYGHKAFMTQSPQLYKQMLVPVFERVFTVAHAYRSEPSVTTRHLSETTQMDCEFGFIDFNELLDLTEQIGREMLQFAYEQNKEVFEGRGVEAPLVAAKFPRLKLREAQEIIFKEFGRDNRSEKDLNPQDEIDICEWAKKNHQSDLVIITHFPTKKRAFYTQPDPEDPEYSLSHDVLFRGLEILSGSIRINDYDQLVEAIKDRGMDPAGFEMYLQAFKYGMPPEGGFSYGLERVTKQLLQLENIREASLYPRDMERVDVRLSTIK